MQEGTIFEELHISNMCTDESDIYFARVIGRIEEIIMDENFIKLQDKFMEEHWREFDEEEENKLAYMEIFKKYIAVIEKFIEEHLVKSIDDFDMRIFERELELV
ncbi:hypothetical protein NQ314_016363 [Rhamnusium bicolor]|uniref:ADP-ribosylation factor-like protein 2-binding protein n=1 Tax=Rhamnusium bicolor TaxID=1586634 RepID=A0AAV8WX94_9CUCU|nr:hypothetical protein NQ314_016363 [Rhamnusium bicolor]